MTQGIVGDYRSNWKAVNNDGIGSEYLRSREDDLMVDVVIKVCCTCATSAAAIQVEVVAAHVVVGTKIGFAVAVIGFPNFKYVGVVGV